MAYTPNPQNYFLGKGSLYFARYDENGNIIKGERHLGNAPDFKISVSVDKKEHFSSQTGLAEKDTEVITGVNATLSFTLEEYTLENLTLALLGEEGLITQSAGSNTENRTAYKGYYLNLPHRNISNVSVSDGTHTYTENVDYRVDEEIGRIFILPQGNIADGTNITISYNYGEFTARTAQALKNAKIEGFLHFIPAKDQYGDNRYEAEIWKVSLAMNGDLGFISDDWGKIEFTGTIIKDELNHPDEPYFRLIELPTASIPAPPPGV